MFSGSSHCLLGQHGSCSSAQLPVELSENMLQNLFLNLPPQTVFSGRPDLRVAGVVWLYGGLLVLEYDPGGVVVGPALHAVLVDRPAVDGAVSPHYDAGSRALRRIH